MPNFDRWRSLLAPGTRWLVVSIVLVAGLAGAVAVGGTVAVLEFTSSDPFCMSCHEKNAVPEWKASVHFLNPAGVAAGCSDCHEPREFIPRMVRKVQAVNEVVGQVKGTISTPEKFQARRLEMAEKEWERMRKNDSAECRACHRTDQMRDPEKAYLPVIHKAAHDGGQTCIDCHKGVAHKMLPGVASVSTGKH